MYVTWSDLIQLLIQLVTLAFAIMTYYNNKKDNRSATNLTVIFLINRGSNRHRQPLRFYYTRCSPFCQYLFSFSALRGFFYYPWPKIFANPIDNHLIICYNMVT